MKDNTTHQLHRQMEEVALLPADDPSRLALVKQIVAVDGRLQQRWLDLLGENERLRLELSRVDVPAELQQHLLEIPLQQRRPAARPWLTWTRFITAAAAVLVILFALFAVDAYRDHRQRTTEQSFATLVSSHHQAMPELSVRSPDWQVIEAALNDRVPFEVRRPDRAPNLPLVGGRAATLKGAPVLYTRWEKDGQVCSLYQFCASDFGLRRPLERTQVTPRSDRLASGAAVILWSEDHCDYALVMESAGPHARSLKI
jgi:hypothetical protein